MRRYTLIHADGSKEHDLTAEDVVEIVNKRYRAEITVADITMIEPWSYLVVVEDGRDALKIQAN